MPEREYTQLLSEEDKIKIRLVTKKGRVLSFVVQYHALIQGRWRTVMRADNCHGTSHIHTYHLQSGEFKVSLGQNNNRAFNEAKSHILRNFSKIKENFLNT
jgi:predicted component of type VI protein secretion system